MAKENRSWSYDRMVGALADLGYNVIEAIRDTYFRAAINEAEDEIDRLGA